MDTARLKGIDGNRYNRGIANGDRYSLPVNRKKSCRMAEKSRILLEKQRSRKMRKEEKNMPKVGVVLSGCGVYDGAEIHEAVLTLLALDRKGADVICMAPDIAQAHVINHRSGEESPGETRNVLTESARIARGDIRDIASVVAADIDALVFPGGFGAAKNLCDFAFKGPDCSVEPNVKRLVQDMLNARKPIVAVCIAPALLARVMGAANLPGRLTIGTDANTGKAIEAMGGVHASCPVNEFVVDIEHRVISTPAYMLGQSISEVAEGIEKTIDELFRLLE
jgi:enhancing lycopene biosynthesis protein 2